MTDVDPTVPLFLNYLLLAVLLGLGWALVRKTAGVSLLAVYCIANALQVGIGFAWLPAFVTDYGFIFDPVAYYRMLNASLIFYLVAIGFIAYELSRTRRREPQPTPVFHANRVSMGVTLVCLIFIGVRLAAPTTAYALKSLDVLFSGDYYKVRSEMIFVGIENYSRLVSWFVNLSRSAILLLFIVYLHNAINGGDRRSKLMVAVTALALFIDAIARLQKGPIVILVLLALGGAVLGRMQRTGHRSQAGFMKYGLVIGLGLIVSSYVASFLQGLDFTQSMMLSINRLIFIPELSTLMHFQAYPDILPFVHFGSMRVVADVFSISTAPVHGSIALDVAHAVTGLLYNANAGLLANAWANLGYTGVMIYAVLACALFCSIDLHVLRRLGAGVRWPLAAYYLSGFLVYANASLEDSLILYGLFFVPFIYLFLLKKSGGAVA